MTADSPPFAITSRGLCAGYDGLNVLQAVDLEVPAGRLVTVVGPNGAGKSTLFKVIVGILAPTAGEIRVLDEPAERARLRGDIAYMPQQEQIDWDFPASVRDVVLSARYGHMRREPGLRRLLPPRFAAARHRAAADRAIAAVDMDAYADRPIGALSGGQKKRTLLARTLAQDARVLLLDEPLSGVDRNSESLIMNVLQQCRNEGRTVITVTHDLVSARAHADHVILLNRTIVGSGPRETMLTDAMLERTAAAPWLTANGGNHRRQAAAAVGSE